MRYTPLNIASILGLLLTCSSVVGAQDAVNPEPMTEQRILYLIDEVEHSGLSFLRGEEKETAAEAGQQLRKKYRMYKERISSPQMFIDVAASRNPFTGRQYLIELSADDQKPLSEWLKGKLAEYNSVHPNAAESSSTPATP